MGGGGGFIKKIRNVNGIVDNAIFCLKTIILIFKQKIKEEKSVKSLLFY